MEEEEEEEGEGCFPTEAEHHLGNPASLKVQLHEPAWENWECSRGGHGAAAGLEPAWECCPGGGKEPGNPQSLQGLKKAGEDLG